MGKFEIRRSSSGYYFRLKANNGKIIVHSEVYNSKQAALRGIDIVQESEYDEIVEDL